MAALSGFVEPAKLKTFPSDSRRQALSWVVDDYEAMRAAALADGHTLTINDAYRSYQRQVQIKRDYIAQGRGNYAATPGTSNHGWGQALDIQIPGGSFTSPVYLWLSANAHKYGFVHPAWARSARSPEPWHWEHPTNRSVYQVVAQAASKPSKESSFLMALTDSEQLELLALMRETRNRTIGFDVQRYRTPGNGAPVSPDAPGATPCRSLDDLDGEFLVAKIDALTAQVNALAAKVG